MPLEKSEDTVPVALYIRTLPGDPGNFLQAQLTALQRYARRRQLDAARVFFDIQGAGASSRRCWPRRPVSTRPSGGCWSTTRDGSAAGKRSCRPGWRGTGSG